MECRGSWKTPLLEGGDLAVSFRTAVPVKLPYVANLPDFIEVQIRHKEFVLVGGGLCNNFSPRCCKIGGAVKFADIPGGFFSDAIDGADKITVGDGMGRLFQFPEIS